jgi:hypothetical protein
MEFRTKMILIAASIVEIGVGAGLTVASMIGPTNLSSYDNNAPSNTEGLSSSQVAGLLSGGIGLMTIGVIKLACLGFCCPITKENDNANKGSPNRDPNTEATPLMPTV